MSSLLALLLLAAGVAVVVGGAELFFEGLLASASRFGASAFVITVVLSGFELENLAAGIAANLKGFAGAAAGTFLGGTTFLALAVPGLAALFSPIDARLEHRALAWTAAAPLPALGLSLDGDLSRADGALLIAWFVVALVAVARTGAGSRASDEPVKRRHPLLALFAGLALLSGGGELLGEGLRRTVSHVGISQTLLGNTAVAASVELEEVARSVVPARRGRGDLALANVAGTIVHFISFNAGVIALVKPLELDDATRYLHVPVAVASPALLCGLLAWRAGISRRAGVFLLLLYGVYVAAAIVVAASG